jgi:hypothetical protein
MDAMLSSMKARVFDVESWEVGADLKEVTEQLDQVIAMAADEGAALQSSLSNNPTLVEVYVPASVSIRNPTRGGL